MLGRLVTSRASRSLAMSSRSAAIRRSRASATLTQRADESAKGKLVPVRSEAAHDRDGVLRQHRPPALLLAGVDVREVHLHIREVDADEGVADRETRVSVGAGVDDDSIRAVGERVNRADEIALSIVLRAVHFDGELLGDRGQRFLDLAERGVTVDVRLAPAEQI